ncbi:uncharacterized protein BDR25DRAFT_353257 [Lindgomyces ingoldianus]|uniref:Uncharacterized protein n=1 Tax=Lindgomyces ingoldianus TaxID=673940 RepID=A0ACB6R130_9PLEO|nr:uncharacterized protein BDR25DRAFT_353257 [Lindgomyces ingoldianus]KAF2472948.1 hypothetical protein BDR25DRAFT_353257 [Lindgomyces ingoldianus]
MAATGPFLAVVTLVYALGNMVVEYNRKADILIPKYKREAAKNISDERVDRQFHYSLFPAGRPDPSKYPLSELKLGTAFRLEQFDFTARQNSKYLTRQLPEEGFIVFSGRGTYSQGNPESLTISNFVEQVTVILIELFEKAQYDRSEIIMKRLQGKDFTAMQGNLQPFLQHSFRLYQLNSLENRCSQNALMSLREAHKEAMGGSKYLVKVSTKPEISMPGKRLDVIHRGRLIIESGRFGLVPARTALHQRVNRLVSKHSQNSSPPYLLRKNVLRRPPIPPYHGYHFISGSQSGKDRESKEIDSNQHSLCVMLTLVEENLCEKLPLRVALWHQPITMIIQNINRSLRNRSTRNLRLTSLPLRTVVRLKNSVFKDVKGWRSNRCPSSSIGSSQAMVATPTLRYSKSLSISSLSPPPAATGLIQLRLCSFKRTGYVIAQWREENSSSYGVTSREKYSRRRIVSRYSYATSIVTYYVLLEALDNIQNLTSSDTSLKHLEEINLNGNQCNVPAHLEPLNILSDFLFNIEVQLKREEWSRVQAIESRVVRNIRRQRSYLESAAQPPRNHHPLNITYFPFQDVSVSFDVELARRHSVTIASSSRNTHQICAYEYKNINISLFNSPSNATTLGIL